MKHRLLFLVVFTVSISVPATAQTLGYAGVISANAYLCDTPSVASASQQEITEGALVKVLDQKLPWYVVRFSNRLGWMHGNTLKFIGTQHSEIDAPRPPTVVPDYGPSTRAGDQRLGITNNGLRR
ncbi:MAG: hypothetical protein ACR2H4_10310 [Pyrinomonadaceae bacterium]